MPLKIFSGPFLYWRQLNECDHKNIKSKMLKYVNSSDEYREICDDELKNATTNYSSDPERNELQREEYLEAIVFDTITELTYRVNSSKNLLCNIDYADHIVTNAWYTKYRKGGCFDWHDHYSTPRAVNGRIYYPSFSLIYILNDENDKNSTIFRKPSDHFVPPFHNGSGSELNTSNYEDIKEGTVLIFPSDLHHKVIQSVHSNRIIISYNVLSSYN
jgi:hypothetical protein